MFFIYSKECFTEKPEGKKVADLQKPWAYVFDDCDVPTIARRISEGRAWRAGLYNSNTDSFKKANVRRATILALDFDASPFEPEEIVEYAGSIGIMPTLWYYSYSQGVKEGNNFRVLWVLEEPIKPVQYETIYANLLEAFSAYQPDRATKDASRLWFGTRQSATIICEKPVPLSVIGWLGVCKKLEEGQTVQKAKKAVKGCENEFFTQDAGSIEPCYINQANKWWERLHTRCWLWDKWEKGEYLNYNQRLTLFTNLKYLKHTDKNNSVFRDVMKFYNATTYAGHSCDEAQIRSMFVNTTLVPLGIVDVGEESPITVVEYFRRGYTNVVNTVEKISLMELDAMLNEKMPALLDADGVVYIKAQTACGKTHRVINWLVSQDLSQKKIIYSVPRYTNIAEFETRFMTAQAEAGQVPGTNMISVPAGKYNQTDLLLMEMGFPARTRQDARYSAIQRMVNPEAKGLFIATHQLLAHLRSCPADCIIVDENIEEALLDVVIMDKGGLGGLVGYLTNSEDRQTILSFIDLIDDGKRGDAVDITPIRNAIKNGFNWDGYIHSAKPMAGVAKLLDVNSEPRITGEGERKSIRFATRSTLISEALRLKTPIKLLSATPLSARLSAMYGTDQIETFCFPIAENKGKIIQYRGMTGAKGHKCEKIPALIEYVVSKVPPEDRQIAKVLSFKEAIPQWREAGFDIPQIGGVDLHLANNSGLDILKGQIVIVAGKYDDNDDKYLDLYYDLHPDATEEPIKKQQTVEINGLLQKLYVWADADLRAFQIENIQLYLEQSAGRARALREAGAKVYLFANFPIADADVYDE